MESSGQSRFSEGQINVPDSRPDNRMPLVVLERVAAKKEWNNFMLNLTEYCFRDCVKTPYDEDTMNQGEK